MSGAAIDGVVSTTSMRSARYADSSASASRAVSVEYTCSAWPLSSHSSWSREASKEKE